VLYRIAIRALAVWVGLMTAGLPSTADAADPPPAVPDLSPEVLLLALDSVRCAQRSGLGVDAARLAVIDYSIPSLEPRLWVFQLATGELLFRDHVAHGRGTGENFAIHFSNQPGSHQTSLGLFLTDNVYTGRNGYSLRMDGLEPGINDLARERAIVMHGAPYVDPVGGKEHGRLGRSWGCPAVRSEVARPIIDALAEGQFVFAYYPDLVWLTSSRFFSCGARTRDGNELLVPSLVQLSGASGMVRLASERLSGRRSEVAN
jgi:hypothetical protein